MASRALWPTDLFAETLEVLMTRGPRVRWIPRLWGAALWAPGAAACLIGPLPSWPNPCSWRSPAYGLDFNRRRALANRAVGRRLKQRLILEQRGRCALCFDLMKPVGQLIDRPNLDHILPIALGGPDTASNLRLVHYHCNVLRAAFEHQGTTSPKDYQRAHRLLSKAWRPPASLNRKTAVRSLADV